MNTIEQLVSELKSLRRAYVNLLESGRDRILDLGGTCDPVDVMEAGNPHLSSTVKAIAAGEAELKREPFGFWFAGERRFTHCEEAEKYFDAEEAASMLMPLYTRE
jgi:hypothetical protein